MVTDIWVNLFSYKFLINTFLPLPPAMQLNRWENVKQMGKLELHFYISKKCFYCLLLYSMRTIKILFFIVFCKVWEYNSTTVFSESKNKSWYFCRQMAKHVVILSACANKDHCSLTCFKTLAFILFTELFIKICRKLTLLCLCHNSCRR